MAQRVVIRIGELASFPAQEARPPQPAQPAEKGKRAKKAKPARPAKPAKKGKLPVSPATIWRWTREGKFPKPFKIGASVTVWDMAEVDAFLAAQRGEEGV